MITKEQLLEYHFWYLENRATLTTSDPKTMVDIYIKIISNK